MGGDSFDELPGMSGGGGFYGDIFGADSDGQEPIEETEEEVV